MRRRVTTLLLLVTLWLALPAGEALAHGFGVRYDIPVPFGWFRAVFTGGPFLFGLRLLSVALFSLVVASGLIGNQEPTANLAPTFVWILWWVGLAFFTALVGNLWELVNPWKVLFEWAGGTVSRVGLGKGVEPYVP